MLGSTIQERKNDLVLNVDVRVATTVYYNIDGSPGRSLVRIRKMFTENLPETFIITIKVVNNGVCVMVHPGTLVWCLAMHAVKIVAVTHSAWHHNTT